MIANDSRDRCNPRTRCHQPAPCQDPYGARVHHSAHFPRAQSQQQPVPHYSRGPIDDEVADFSDEALLGTKYVRKSYGRDLTPPPLPPGSRIQLPRLGPIDREIPDFSTKALERG